MKRGLHNGALKIKNKTTLKKKKNPTSSRAKTQSQNILNIIKKKKKSYGSKYYPTYPALPYFLP